MKERDDVDRMSMKELQREVRRLRAREYATDGRALDNFEILQAGAGAALQTAVKQRDKYQVLLAECNEYAQGLQKKLEEFNQYFEAMHATGQAHPGETVTGGAVFTLAPGSDRVAIQLVRPQRYLGTPDEAEREVYPALVYALARYVLPEDLSGKGFESLSEGEMFRIIHRLARVKDLAPESFRAERRRAFAEVWTWLRANDPNYMQEPPLRTRGQTQDLFNTRVERTLEARDKRIAAHTLPQLPDALIRQNLSNDKIPERA